MAMHFLLIYLRALRGSNQIEPTPQEIKNPVLITGFFDEIYSQALCMRFPVTGNYRCHSVFE